MFRRASNGWEKHIDFMLWDMLCLQMAYGLANVVCQGVWFPFYNPIYRNMVFIFFLCQVFVLFSEENFKNIMRRRSWDELKATFRQSVLLLLIVSCYLFSTKTAYSRLTLFITWEVYFMFSYGMRCLWKKILGKKRNGERFLIVITTAEMAESVLRDLQVSVIYGGVNIVGLALAGEDAADRMGTEIGGVPVVADIDTVARYISRELVDEVLLTLPRKIPLSEKLYSELVEMGVTVHLRILHAVKREGKKQSVGALGSYTVLSTSVNMVSLKDAFYKRVMDIMGGIVGCLITLVFCVIIGPIIYLQSPGSIFYAQERVGKNGRTFKLYKFRSMYPDADARKKALMEQNGETDSRMFKMKDDPRIIGGRRGIGAFIRKYSIDEFPQFWNVLKGDMSLVGTRPPTRDEWDKYELWHRVRLAAKPGITGMWQVSGRSKITDFDEVVRLDREYIQRWSKRLDMLILVKTVLLVFKGDGAW